MFDVLSKIATELRLNGLEFTHHILNENDPNRVNGTFYDGEHARIWVYVENRSPVPLKNIRVTIKPGRCAIFNAFEKVVDYLPTGERMLVVEMEHIQIKNAPFTRTNTDMLTVINLEEAYADFTAFKFTDFELILEQVTPKVITQEKQEEHWVHN